jgi:Zn-dependent protease with chaperone function
MGYQGKMLGLGASWFSYALALGFLAWGLILWLKLIYQAYQSLKAINIYPQEVVARQRARILNTPFPYCAQIGFWHPQLVISQGLIDSLDGEHLQAVLAHESAHKAHNDTFWFFWLGWLRAFTSWLPNTESLWQELLFLREIRADYHASRHVDGLILAESLLIVKQNIHKFSYFSEMDFCAAFHDPIPENRLQERIEALLTDVNSSPPTGGWSWLYFGLTLLPLMTVPLHG